VAGEPSWKKHERRAAVLIRGTRHWANSGQAVDAESSWAVVQAKEVQRLSLAELESLAVESARQGAQLQKVGMVVVKRRAGAGRQTPVLVVMTEHAFREMNSRRSAPPPLAMRCAREVVPARTRQERAVPSLVHGLASR